jgi:hypothetical protein
MLVVAEFTAEAGISLSQNINLYVVIDTWYSWSFFRRRVKDVIIEEV